MKKLFSIFILSLALTGCGTFSKPVIQYETKIVKVPAVASLPQEPQLDKMDSAVKMLTDESSDGDVAKAYKSDWLILMNRDSLYTDFFSTYKKAREANEQARTSGTKD